MYYSVITVVALFIAIIINDAIQNNLSNISNHAFLGFLSFLAVFFLCMKDAETVAWGVIVIPMFIIALSFVLSYSNSDSKCDTYDSQPSQLTQPSPSQSAKPPMIQLPVSTTPASSSSNITPSGAGCSVHTDK
jgi:hypothetical protein